MGSTARYVIRYRDEEGVEHSLATDWVHVDFINDSACGDNGAYSRTKVLRGMSVGESVTVPYTDDKDYICWRTTACHLKFFGTLFKLRHIVKDNLIIIKRVR